MEASLLYRSPFTDLTPRGPDGLFTSGQVDELIAVLERVKATALAVSAHGARKAAACGGEPPAAALRAPPYSRRREI